MNDEQTTRSSANTEPQLLSENGGIQLKDFNPRGVLRFADRLCRTCNGPIMDHWLIHEKDPDLRAEYWCDREGTQFSQGMIE
jgi:hypothetical protein